MLLINRGKTSAIANPTTTSFSHIVEQSKTSKTKETESNKGSVYLHFKTFVCDCFYLSIHLLSQHHFLLAMIISRGRSEARQVPTNVDEYFPPSQSWQGSLSNLLIAILYVGSTNKSYHPILSPLSLFLTCVVCASMSMS